MTTRDVDISEIPQEALDQVENGLRHYSIQILAFWETAASPELKLVGSGTLVEVNGRHYIWGLSPLRTSPNDSRHDKQSAC